MPPAPLGLDDLAITWRCVEKQGCLGIFAFLEFLGLPWKCLATSWGILQHLDGSLGASWSTLGGILESLARIFEHFGDILEHFGSIVEPLGGILEQLGDILEHRRGILGVSWGHLGTSWARLGGILGVFRSILDSSCRNIAPVQVS